jgi:hypothetical protein
MPARDDGRMTPDIPDALDREDIETDRQDERREA